MSNMSTHNGHHIYHIPLSSSSSSSSSKPGAPPPLEVKHKCDGVILQPDAAYVGGTDFTLFKWKFQDHVTVDMQVTFHDGEASFSCNHNGGVEVECQRATVSLDEFDTARLAADVHAHLSGGGGGRGGVAIAEIGLDPTSGCWFYHPAAGQDAAQRVAHGAQHADGPRGEYHRRGAAVPPPGRAQRQRWWWKWK